MNKGKALIILDSDVVIHLLKAEKFSLLNELYPNRIRMLDIVYQELTKNKFIRGQIDNLFRFKQVEEIVFPIKLFSGFARLKSRMNGIGERACLVYCLNNEHIIASSNTSDIRQFCTENSIPFLTTLDLFCVAIRRGLLSIDEVNRLMQRITYDSGSYLCCDRIEDHLKDHFNEEICFIERSWLMIIISG